MHVIILAAGQSKRFQEEGYFTPKPFLAIEWRGQTTTMLGHVIRTIPNKMEDIVIAIPPGWFHEGRTIEIEETKGPAHTALQILDQVQPFSCLIIDSDILNTTNDLERLSKVTGCAVLVSKSANPAYSYVDKLGAFTRIHEKKQISSYAVRGAYFVSYEHMQEFVRALDDVVGNMQEPFISHAFDLMSCPKTAFETTYDPIDWGTPRDIRISGAHIISEKEVVHARD